MHLLKYLFIFLMSFIFFNKLSDSKISYTKIGIYAVILAVISDLYRDNYPLFTIVFCFGMFTLLSLFCTPLQRKPAFLVSLISFCMSYSVFIFWSCCYRALLLPFGDLFPDSPDLIAVLFSGIMSLVFCYGCRLHKFKKGIKHLYSKPFINIIIIIGVVIIVCLTIPQVITSPDLKMQLMPLLILASTFLLFFLWQQQMKRYYMSKLRKLELESLRQELAEKDKTIKELMESNDHLARTIHKDNKLIPAMLSAVNDYLSYTGDENAKPASHGKALAAQLKELGNDRLELLKESTHTNESLPQTGYAAVDAMLSYMGKRAESQGIAFQVKLHPNFSSRIDADVSEADLTHLLSDLIENALIATKTAEHKSVLVHLGILYNAPTMEISDTGSPFAPEVYQDFGLSRHSTHLDNGGSGIGLMDIWKLKKKYAASLHIYEYPPTPEGFSKKICLVFDHKKHYLIRSCRSQELLNVQTRGDLYILPLAEGTD